MPRQGSSLEVDTGVAKSTAMEMPSWSWTAWQGGFRFADDERAQATTRNGYPDGRRLLETSPITEWFTGNEPSSCNRRRIGSNWHVDRQDADDKDKPLPEGWTRMEARAMFEALNPWQKASSRPCIYRHQGLGTEPPTFWHYPFRMPEIGESTPSVTPEQTRCLFCKTWKASVWLYRRWDRSRNKIWTFLDTELWAVVPDLRKESSRIGQLWLHLRKRLMLPRKQMDERLLLMWLR